MKKAFIAISLLFSFCLADSINIDFGAKSNHIAKGEFNEDHNWLGLSYRFIEEDKYSLQVEGVKFINSYNTPTKFIAVTGIYTPLKYKDIKFGISGSVGYQKGYCVSLKGTKNCSEQELKDGSNKSLLFLYGLYAELDNFFLTYTYIPNSVEAVRFGFKALEW